MLLVADVLQAEPHGPSGVTTVDVDLTEFALLYDPSTVTDGNVGFSLENVGEQEHEFFLIKARKGPQLFELPELIGTDQLELFGGAEVEPGKVQNLVFAAELSPGRYAVVCFLPDVNDPEGTPHALMTCTAQMTRTRGNPGPCPRGAVLAKLAFVAPDLVPLYIRTPVNGVDEVLDLGVHRPGEG